MSDVDDVDFRLLAALHEDALRSHATLGRIVGLSAPSVRARLLRLEAAGILEGFWASPHPSLFGRAEPLWVDAGPCTEEDALRALALPDVAWVAWKVDGGLTVQSYPRDVEAGRRELASFFSRPAAYEAVGVPRGTPEPSPLDWRVLDAVLARPRHAVRDLVAATGLSAKTVRGRRDRMRAEGLLDLLPRLGGLAEGGDVVFHLVVFGPAREAEVVAAARDAVVVNATGTPPVLYLLCRAPSLPASQELAARAVAVAGVERAVVTLNRRFWVDGAMLRRWVQERISAWERARRPETKRLSGS